MQIHELNSYNGNLDSGAYIAIDNGSDTGKISAAAFLDGVEGEIEQVNSDLNGRIDNIIAGGSAPSESEIIDARYGDDGITYSSLGSAIRNQLANVKEDVADTNSGLLDNAYPQSSDKYVWGNYSLVTGEPNIAISPYMYVIDYWQNPIKLLSDDITVNIQNGYEYRGCIYNEDLSFNSSFTVWANTSGKPAALQNKKGLYVKFIIKKTDETAFSQAELDALNSSLYSVVSPVPYFEKVDTIETDITNVETVLSDISEETPANANLFKPNYTEGYYIDASNVIQPGANWKYTPEYIRVESSLYSKLYVKLSVTVDTFVFIWVDKDYNPTGGSSSVPNLLSKVIDIPENAYYFRIYTRVGYSGDVMMSYTDTNYVAYDEDHKVDAGSIDGYFAAGNVLNNKNVVFLGDSIFGRNQSESGISNLFHYFTNANVANFAFGGTRATLHPGSTPNALGWQKFDGISIANAIANGDFTDQEAAIAGGAMGEPAYFSTSLAALEAYDFSDCDYIVAEWGTNDWTGGASINDYKNALRNIVQTILTAYPQIVFILATPFMRFFEDNGNFYNSSVYDYRNDGVYLSDFVDATAVLSEQPYNLQIVDCYNIGINDYTRTAFFSNNDWTHHDARGRRRIARYLSNNVY